MVKFIKSQKTGEYIKIDPNDKDSLKYVTQFVRTFTEIELREERDTIIRAIGNPSIEVEADSQASLDAIMNKDQIDKDLAAITIMNAHLPLKHS